MSTWLDWKENDNGNYVCVDDDDEMMTVYQIESGEWCGRNNTHRLKGNYDTAQEAQEAMERVLNGDTSLVKPIVTGWSASKKGGYYRHTQHGIVCVKQAKSGKWYVIMPDSRYLTGQWFDTVSAAKRIADELTDT